MLDALEEVAVSAPAGAVEQDALVDHLGPCSHRRGRALRALARAVEARRALDLDDLAPFGAQLCQVGPLVLIALAREQAGGVGTLAFSSSRPSAISMSRWVRCGHSR